MQVALTSPMLKLFLLSGLGLGMGALYATANHPVAHRLVLHAPVASNATYLSAWSDGDVTLEFPGGTLRAFQYEVTADMTDHCRWMGIETLIPIDDHTFSYDYREAVLSCDRGAKPAKMTPRVGTVTVAE